MASAAANHLNSLDDLVKLLESLESDLAKEVKQQIHDQFNQVRDSWLVHGLYDHHTSTSSPSSLEVLLDVPEPHDRYLCDKMCEGLKAGGKSRLTALSVLGYVIRKQPPWLYRLTHNALMKEVVKVLKTEDDLVIMISALLDVLTLMPIVPSYISPYLHDLFEVFSRVASWRYQHVQALPEAQKLHLQISLYAFFHRLYGMFPCNFLSYLRSQYSESNKENQVVFSHTIRPMLTTVRMHPLLVTHSRDLEKTVNRWKKLEVHDVVVESSRYSLLNQEGTKEDQEPPSLEIEMYAAAMKSSDELSPEVPLSLLKRESLWTPSQVVDVNVGTPPAHPHQHGQQHHANPVSESLQPGLAQLRMDSPPEAAIEATPESTPFVTPVKEEASFLFPRPAPSNQSIKQLKLDSPSVRSTGSGRATQAGQPQSPKSPQSSMKDFPLFKCPEETFLPRRYSVFETTDFTSLKGPEETFLPRRYSIFKRPAEASQVGTDLSKVGTDRSEEGKDGAAAQPVGTTSVAPPDLSQSPASVDNQSSPVRFTSERPGQFPVKPEPERPAMTTDAVRSKMLSLETLKDALTPDYCKDDDDEVSEITGGASELKTNLSTRHITPQICLDSGATSRTISRMSTSSQPDPQTSVSNTNDPSEPQGLSECKSGGIHLPDKSSLDDFVRRVRRRMRFLSVCEETARLIPGNVDDAFKEMGESDLKRTASCPTEHALHTVKLQGDGDGPYILTGEHQGLEASNSDSGCKFVTAEAEIQTDELHHVYQYEHLFPSALPQWFTRNIDAQGGESVVSKMDDAHANPYELLDNYLQSLTSSSESAKDEAKLLKDEVSMLHSLMLYERHRREILGLRNRRLLGRTKSSRILEEQNTALRNKLETTEDEKSKLLAQLETVRREKHEVEESRGRGAKQRDEKIEELVSANVALSEDVRNLKERLTKTEEELLAERQEMSKLQRSYFNATSEVGKLQEKEEIRRRTERELHRLRQEVLLSGELIVKYREKLREPSRASSKEQDLAFETYLHEVEGLKSELMKKSNALDSYRAKCHDLEQQLTRRELDFAEQKRIVKQIKDENVENVKSVEDENSALMHTQSELEMEILRLNGELAQARHSRSIHTGSSRASYGASAVGGVAARHSEGVDIVARTSAGRGRDQSVGSSSGLEENKSFVVGSPPSSSAGSVDVNEIMRRLHGDDNLDDTDPRSSEVGSAVSAREGTLGTSSSPESTNEGN